MRLDITLLEKLAKVRYTPVLIALVDLSLKKSSMKITGSSNQYCLQFDAANLSLSCSYSNHALYPQKCFFSALL